MSEPTTPLPASKAFDEDERSVLLGYLDYHRKVLARKAEGITDEQARIAACPPSGLTLLGLVRHMAGVERMWFRRALVGEDVPSIFEDDEGLDPPPDATLAEAFELYWAEIEIADRNIAAAALDDFTQGEPDPGQHKLRRTIVHMIEEYARHCGHADLLRQAVDGSTGD